MTEIIDKDKYVRNIFNTIASKYDLMNLIMTWGMLPGWQKFLLKKTRLTKGNKALDVCCGTGELAMQMAELVGPEGQVWGLDFAQKMLKIAQEKVDNSEQKNITFVEGDALQLPFPDDNFDSVTNGFALRNVLDISGVIQEMTRVVKPGGTVVCIEVSRPQNFLLRMGFNLYFFKVVPLIGKIVDKGKAIDNKFPPYTWLPESLKTFPSQEEIKRIFQGAGLKEVKYYPLGFGAVTVYVGVKRTG